MEVNKSRITIIILPIVAVLYIFSVMFYRINSIPFYLLVVLWFWISIKYFRKDKFTKSDTALFVYFILVGICFILITVFSILIVLGFLLH